MKWTAIPIKKLCVRTGKRDPRDNPDESFRYIDISSIDRERKIIAAPTDVLGSEAPSRARQEVFFDDVLVSTVRPNLNAVAMVPEELDGEIASTGFCVLRAEREKLHPRYLFYWTQTSRFIRHLTQRVRGANYPAVTDSIVKSSPIPYAPPTEQRRIVELLDQADALRRMRREADALAERVLPALFYQMFGDPATNPMGWEETTLAQACEIVTGNTPSRKVKEYFGGEIPWARPADLDATLPLFETEEYLTESGAEVGRLVPENSILVCCIGATLGKVGLAGTEMAINQQINALLPSKRCTSEFLYTFCTLTAGVFRGAARKSTLPILNKTRFGEQRLVVPPIEKQEEFSRAFRHSLRIGPFRATSAKALNDLFTLMLQRAFSGELTSAWREAHMEELLQEMEAQAKYLEEA